MSKKYNPADFSEQFKQGVNLVALAMDKLADFPLGDFSPLSVSLDGYWDEPFSELPIKLQAEVSKAFDDDDPQFRKPTARNGFFDLADPEAQRALQDVCRGMGWDLQSPEQRRRQISEWDSRHYPETSAEGFIWMAEQKIKQRELRGEIEKWEGMNTQGTPSEEKIKKEMLDKLRAELSKIEQQLKLSHTADAMEARAEMGVPAGQAATDAMKNTTSKANEQPPGKMPRTAIGKLAIKAAWQIERETKRPAIVNFVITRLQEWVEHEDELLEKIKGGVRWQTKGCKANNFDIEACAKALERWHKSRH
ncbi:MAG: hypothetical protein Q7S51_11910 [Gallionellaceae bacterium]|nr:hypothetical protein [Gallionellaceae bacterium]